MQPEPGANKRANRALSLDASKILERVFATGAFVHIVAVGHNEKAELAPAVPISDSPLLSQIGCDQEISNGNLRSPGWPILNRHSVPQTKHKPHASATHSQA